MIETPRSHDQVLRELRAIDDRLFLERQLTLDEQVVWCVVVNVGGDQPPLTILEWRDEDDKPIPELTSRLVARVAAMERDGKRLTANVIRKNKEMIERKRLENQEHYRDLSNEMVPLITGRKRPVLHRGVGLRQARDRARAQGWKV